MATTLPAESRSRVSAPQGGDGLLDAPLARLGLLGALDGAYVLALVTVRKVLVGGARDRVVVQGSGEVRGLDDDPWLGVERQLDLDLVADRNTRGLPVGVAEAEQVAVAAGRSAMCPTDQRLPEGVE
ncbi:hypothetical protein [Micromonospora zamorensis]|uniref:hypothetical protein n=1 Tax=Micromonospora zamorensis TaxID=709883 RepID=UPI003F4D34D4